MSQEGVGVRSMRGDATSGSLAPRPLYVGERRRASFGSPAQPDPGSGVPGRARADRRPAPGMRRVQAPPRYPHTAGKGLGSCSPVDWMMSIGVFGSSAGAMYTNRPTSANTRPCPGITNRPSLPSMVEVTVPSPLSVTKNGPATGCSRPHEHVAVALGRLSPQALAVLHDRLLVAGVAEAGIPLPAPMPQAETAEIRARLPHLIDSEHVPLVVRWCHWVDAAGLDLARGGFEEGGVDSLEVGDPA